jgi:hypothetical protein
MKKSLLMFILFTGSISVAQEKVKAGECPMGHSASSSKNDHTAQKGTSNEDWWPNK